MNVKENGGIIRTSPPEGLVVMFTCDMGLSINWLPMSEL